MTTRWSALRLLDHVTIRRQTQFLIRTTTSLNPSSNNQQSSQNLFKRLSTHPSIVILIYFCLVSKMTKAFVYFGNFLLSLTLTPEQHHVNGRRLIQMQMVNKINYLIPLPSHPVIIENIEDFLSHIVSAVIPNRAQLTIGKH